MADRQVSYDITLVQDDAERGLDLAAAAISRIRSRYASILVPEVDVFFLEPRLLVCVLHFDPARFGDKVLKGVALDARRGHLRVLKPMRLSEQERAAFYNDRLARVQLRELAVIDIGPVLERLKVHLAAPPTTAGRGAGVPDHVVTMAGESQFLDLYTDASRARRRLFVASDQPRDIGAEVLLSILLESGQGPLRIGARVVPDHSRRARPGPGFVAELGLTPEEHNLLESFLIAVRRATVWPERSGRRYERFPMRLAVSYRYDGQERREQTSNVSRGGLFVESMSPPAIGALLELTLQGPGTAPAKALPGEVVYSADAAAVIGSNATPGMGVRFVGPPDLVRGRLESLLGTFSAPAAKRALVVDDDRFWRRVVGSGLAGAGFEVLEARDGDEGLRMVLDELLRLDVLILDIYMPGLSGLELADKIRRVGHEDDLAIVLLTGVPVEELERQAFAHLGIDDVIPKAVSPEEIVRRIERVIHRREAAETAQG